MSKKCLEENSLFPEFYDLGGGEKTGCYEFFPFSPLALSLLSPLPLEERRGGGGQFRSSDAGGGNLWCVGGRGAKKGRLEN